MSAGAQAPSDRLRGLAIRRVRTIDELTAASDVVDEVTGYRDLHPGVLLSVVETGGYVGAAYDGERCVGSLYGLLGLREGRPYLHSEMAAVLPSHQGRGLAQALKLDQRAFALEQGMDLVTWTYDPLRGMNANLNIRRLGTEVAGYAPDLYGSLPGFSGGWPTDQLLLEWRVASDRVRTVLDGTDVDARFGLEDLTEITTVTVREDGVEDLAGWVPGLRDHLLLLRVPQNVQELRALDMEVVLRWRHGVREAFQHYLAAGYHVEWFVPQTAPQRRNVYVLSRERLV
jgi:chorismate synthase